MASNLMSKILLNYVKTMRMSPLFGHRYIRTVNVNDTSHAEVITDEDSRNEWTQIKDVFNAVNEKIVNDKCVRNYAVIHIYGNQHVIHENDIILIHSAMSADNGERIKLEKCLLIGNDTFTLIGRPIVNRDLCHIEATVLEKTMSHTYYNLFAIPRNHAFRRYRFIRTPITLLRINEISICHKLNESQTHIQ